MKFTCTPGPYKAERLCLDGVEWFINSTSMNLPPFHWNPRLTVHIKPLFGYKGSCSNGINEGLKENYPSVLNENRGNALMLASSWEMAALLRDILYGGQVLTPAHKNEAYGILARFSKQG